MIIHQLDCTCSYNHTHAHSAYIISCSLFHRLTCFHLSHTCLLTCSYPACSTIMQHIHTFIHEYYHSDIHLLLCVLRHPETHTLIQSHPHMHNHTLKHRHTHTYTPFSVVLAQSPPHGQLASALFPLLVLFIFLSYDEHIW